MTADTKHFEKVTLLITHYNRSHSLERLLESFADAGISFKETIVSDDASKPEHLNYLENLKNRYKFNLITSLQNRGLGNNLNKGQDAVNTEYTLYVQEDFCALDLCSTYLSNAFDIMEADKTIDTVRFYSYLGYPNLLSYKKGFSEMIFNPWSLDIAKITKYSDHPHLRRSNFFQKFGRYCETKKSDQMEYDMMVSYLKNRGRGLLADKFKSVFDQANSTTEPSTVKRNSLRYDGSLFIALPRFIYRTVKFNFRYFFKR